MVTEWNIPQYTPKAYSHSEGRCARVEDYSLHLRANLLAKHAAWESGRDILLGVLDTDLF